MPCTTPPFEVSWAVPSLLSCPKSLYISQFIHSILSHDSTTSHSPLPLSIAMLHKQTDQLKITMTVAAQGKCKGAGECCVYQFTNYSWASELRINLLHPLSLNLLPSDANPILLWLPLSISISIYIHSHSNHQAWMDPSSLCVPVLPLVHSDIDLLGKMQVSKRWGFHFEHASLIHTWMFTLSDCIGQSI